MTSWLRKAKLDRPASYQFDRIVRGTRHEREQGAYREVLTRLDKRAQSRLDDLLHGEDPWFDRLRADPGRVGLESLLSEAEKLQRLRALALPEDILKPFHPELVKRLRRRAATESVWELRRHSDEVRLPLLVFFSVPREAEIVDGLVELLMQVTHRMGDRAERRVVEELLADFRHVRGKTGILYRIAEAAVEQPEGLVREVIFPIAGKDVMEALVKEYHAGGKAFQQRVHTVLRGSYGSHYRRMLPKLLEVLEFHSNNAVHKPLLEAIDTIRSKRDEQRQYYKLSDIKVEGVIRPKWRDVVVEEAPDGEERVNRINWGTGPRRVKEGDKVTRSGPLPAGLAPETGPCGRGLRGRGQVARRTRSHARLHRAGVPIVAEKNVPNLAGSG